ncbi:MAG: SpoIIE family protein phosphatase [Caldithrix sp.]|nr:SpoIIE family protein phosphatase [Caldithrix sp.]
MFKNVKKEEITIPAQMSYLIQVREFIERIGKKYKYSDKITNSFKLVIDEACTNIIRHGYRDIKNGEVTLKAIIRRLSLTIIIIDQGTSYDIRQANTPNLAKYVDIGKKGGLGIMMMRKLMDDIQYSVTERGNELRLTKNRESTEENTLLQRWHSLNLRTKYSSIASVIFTLVVIFIFGPIFMNIQENTREEVFQIAMSSSRSLADNVIADLINDNDLSLFEKARSIKNNYPNIIHEAYLVDQSKQIKAISNPLKFDSLGTYRVPTNAGFVDSLGKVNILKYSINDTTHIFDINTEIRQTIQGRGALLGYVHIWVKQETIQNLAEDEKINMAILLAIILTIGYAGAFFLIHRILMPFHSLADWVRQVVRGKVDQDEIDIDASDELGEIAKAFNDMTNKFREAQVTLMEQQKLQKELQVAQEIQQMLLPSDFPNVEGYEIASFYEAAKEVGGDLFDFVEIDDDRIGICVADVSGKGVPGSMIMTMIRTALRLESRGSNNPADVLARVNRFVANDMKRGMFVTMFYIILDSRKRIIHYASAGHNPMVLHRVSSKQTYYLNPSGFPVGIQLPDLNLFDKKIETDSIRLREDDILVLYTDGITEAMNSKRELYREERFLNAIRENAHLDVTGFIKSINKNLKDFTGGAAQNDDITYVAIKEKMMPGEVIVNLHKELERLIKEEKVKVKDALERLRISPHIYYKHKEIIDRKGLTGLKDHLEDQDFIEKKHLSIEVKAKIFDIIKKHPSYGANRIASTLRSDEYGNIKIDSQRLYNELVQMRLNTKELRERYIEKGGGRRLKEPGTPLLTLDGKVILNFESSEKTVAEQRGVKEPEAEDEKPSETAKQPDKKESETPAEEETQAKAEPDQPESEKENVKDHAEETDEKSADEQKPPQPKPVEKPPEQEETLESEPGDSPLHQREEAIQPADADDSTKQDIEDDFSVEKEPDEKTATIDDELVESDSKNKIKPGDAADTQLQEEQTDPSPEETEEIQPESADDDNNDPFASKKEELIKQVEPKIDLEKIDLFYTHANDDVEDIGKNIEQMQSDGDIEKKIKNIILILKIMQKHPILKNISDFKTLLEQIQKTFEKLQAQSNQMSESMTVKSCQVLFQTLKDGQNIDGYESYYQSLNMVGRIKRQIMKIDKDSGEGHASQEMDKIRKQINRKALIDQEKFSDYLQNEDD